MKEKNPILTSVFARTGNMSILARKLGITRQAVSKWRQIPVEHIHVIAKMVRMKPEELRPDIFADKV